MGNTYMQVPYVFPSDARMAIYRQSYGMAAVGVLYELFLAMHQLQSVTADAERLDGKIRVPVEYVSSACIQWGIPEEKALEYIQGAAIVGLLDRGKLGDGELSSQMVDDQVKYSTLQSINGSKGGRPKANKQGAAKQHKPTG